jgi:hypothetical protein
MSFHMALHAANVVLQDALGVPKRIIDRRMNVGVALVGVRLVADIDLLSIRQSEVDMDLEETAGPVMLPRNFHRHAAGRNPAVSLLKRRHVPRDLRAQRFLRFHALKINVYRGFHLCLPDRRHPACALAGLLFSGRQDSIDPLQQERSVEDN